MINQFTYISKDCFILSISITSEIYNWFFPNNLRTKQVKKVYGDIDIIKYFTSLILVDLYTSKK